MPPASVREPLLLIVFFPIYASYASEYNLELQEFGSGVPDLSFLGPAVDSHLIAVTFSANRDHRQVDGDLRRRTEVESA